MTRRLQDCFVSRFQLHPREIEEQIHAEGVIKLYFFFDDSGNFFWFEVDACDLEDIKFQHSFVCGYLSRYLKATNHKH